MRSLDTTPAARCQMRRAAAVKGSRLGPTLMMALAIMCGFVAGAGAETGADPGSAPQVFLQAMDDVPLMAGLTERPTVGVDFETPAGRIVEAEAGSPPTAGLTPARVEHFYEATLAALGWRAVGGGRFTREDEILTIVTSTGRDGLRVRFSLRPK